MMERTVSAVYDQDINSQAAKLSGGIRNLLTSLGLMENPISTKNSLKPLDPNWILDILPRPWIGNNSNHGHLGKIENLCKSSPDQNPFPFHHNRGRLKDKPFGDGKSHFAILGWSSLITVILSQRIKTDPQSPLRPL